MSLQARFAAQASFGGSGHAFKPTLSEVVAMAALPKYLPLLEEITRTDSFHRLAPLEDRSAWRRMTPRERRLLGQLFVRRGGHYLSEGQEGVVESFRLAQELLPDDAEIYFGQGSWWLKHAIESGEAKPLFFAAENFRKAAELSEEHLDALYCWAQTLVRLGVSYGEGEYFSEADALYLRAERLLPEGGAMRSHFFSDWGLVWSLSGALSGEAFDFRVAIEKFEEAAQCGCCASGFWANYGLACWRLGDLLGDEELVEKALPLLRQATEGDECGDGPLLSYASLLTELFSQKGREKDFEEACDLYCRVAEGGGDSPELWNGWAELMLLIYQIHRSEEDLEDAHDFLRRASRVSLEEGFEATAQTARLWSHLIGETLHVEWIDEGRGFIERALECYRDEPDIWAAYSFLLCDMGRVTEDERCYRLAVRKAECGMRLSNTHSLLWHALGRSLLALVTECGEVEQLDRATEAFEKAAVGGERTPALLFDTGRVLLRQGQRSGERSTLEQAVETFELELAAYEVRGEDPPLESLFHYACALDLLGTDGDDGEYYRQAVEIFSEIHQLIPEDSALCFHFAQAVWHWGKAGGDLTCYQRACSLLEEMTLRDPEDGAVWELWGAVLMSYAHCLTDPLRWEEGMDALSDAEEKFLHALRLGFDPALYELARISAGMGGHERAIEWLSEAATRGVLPTKQQIVEDPWFESLRSCEAFQEFIEQRLS